MRTPAAALLLALASCAKSGEPVSAPSASETWAAAPAPEPSQGWLRDARALLANEKAVAGFAAYRREMAPHAKQAVEIFSAARKRASGAKKLGEAGKDDPRAAAYNKLSEAALAKAGLTAAEMRILNSALSSYTGKLSMVREAERQKADLDEKRAAGARPGLGDELAVKVAADAAARFKPAQEEFVRLYGQTALDVVTRHADELMAAQDATLKGMLQK